jgi:hypothetical protein
VGVLADEQEACVSLRADQGVRSARRVVVDLSGVAESVLWTTYQRSVEARRPDAVLDDPKVIELVDRIDYPFEQRFGGRGFGQWQALRARCLDREARAVPRPAPGRYGGGARRGSRNPVLAGRRARPLAERGCAGTARSRDVLFAVAGVTPLSLILVAEQLRGRGADEVHACGVAITGAGEADGIESFRPLADEVRQAVGPVAA